MKSTAVVATPGTTIVIVPPGISRIDAGRRLASRLITADKAQEKLVQRGVHPDLIEVVPHGGREKIGIDQVRDVIHRSQFAPVTGVRKVCVIPHGEALTLEAENALLKVLEEPSPYISFIVLVRDPGDLLPTIRSRSRIVRLPPLVFADAIAQLEERGYSQDEAVYLLDAVGEAEIAPFLEKPVDVRALRAEARDRAESAQGDELCPLLAAGGITAREAGASIILRIIAGNARKLVGIAHTLSACERGAVISLLSTMLRVAFAALRDSLGISPAYPDPALTPIAQRLGAVRLIAIARAAEEARHAVEGYTPAEPVLVWFFLTVNGEVDGG